MALRNDFTPEEYEAWRKATEKKSQEIKERTEKLLCAICEFSIGENEESEKITSAETKEGDPIDMVEVHSICWESLKKQCKGTDLQRFRTIEITVLDVMAHPKGATIVCEYEDEVERDIIKLLRSKTLGAGDCVKIDYC